MCIEQAVRDHGNPEIFNSDRGSWFVCELWTAYPDLHEW